MLKVILRKKIGHRVLNGHPWIFSNEIDMMDDQLEGGDIADVFTSEGKFVGRGYVNPRSTITVRLLTRQRDEVIDAAFFHRRIQKAWDYRRRLGYVENCRLIFGEADDMPQLIIDKFNDHFVIQTLALGIDLRQQVMEQGLATGFNAHRVWGERTIEKGNPHPPGLSPKGIWIERRWA